MLDAARAYPAYKDSGQPWLGEVPEHWEVRSLGSTTNRKAQRNASGTLPLLSVLREKGVVLRSSLTHGENHNFVPDDLSNYLVANEGDLVINKMKAWQGSVGVAPCDGVVSPAYFVFELLGIGKTFAHRLFRSRFYVDAFAQTSDGVRIGQWDLSVDRMKRIPVAVPPPSEQAAIVKVLSGVDRRVNRLVRAKRRLLALLAEQKQAVITHAVTRGLDPNAPTKPSGVPWLGGVPAHWEVVRAKYLMREVDQRSEDGSETHLSMTQRAGLIRSDEMTERRMLSASYAGGKLCEEGDIVLNRLKGHLGVFALASEAGVISPDYTVLRPNLGRVVPEYLEAVLRCDRVRPELRIRVKGVVEGLWRLYTDDLGNIALPCPPLAEQAVILKGAINRLQQIGAAADLARREIDLLREYRTRLVADVVTGKLDVRGVADALPDEGEDDEPVDADGAEADENAEGLEPVLAAGEDAEDL